MASARRGQRSSLVIVFAFASAAYVTHGSTQTFQIHYAPVPRETVETRLGDYSRKDPEREARLKAFFQSAGCDGAQLAEQRVDDPKIPNVICTLPGREPSEIIVGAHFDHINEGAGVVDNWSGAALLPSLYESTRGVPRKHTYLFIGFTEEERGLFGSKYYVRHLKKESLAQIRAMVNLDSLGLGPTEIWRTHSDGKLLAMFSSLAKSMNLPVTRVNADEVGDEDSSSFREAKVPTLMVHSITQETFGILHTDKDKIGAIKLDDYYNTYRLLSAYLAYLDEALD